MTPARLRAPDKTLSISTDLDVVPLPVPELVRISGFATGEPYFGISGGNRFDAPGCLANSPEYATCYLGLSFDVAFAESLLHDAMPFKGRFRVASSEFDRRWVHRFVASLDLFDLTGYLLKTMGGHAGLSGTGSFKVTQKWAKAIFDNPRRVDGFIYISRHLPNSQAVVLFDRARSKLALSGKASSLNSAPELLQAIRNFRIEVPGRCELSGK